MKSFKHTVAVFPALALTLALQSCSVQQIVSRNLADTLAQPEQGGEDDPDLVREASPFYLKLADSVLQDNPTHIKLATRVTSGFVQYAYAFLGQEADFIEPKDPAKADALRQRGKKLYHRAKRRGFVALSRVMPDFENTLQSGATLTILPEHVELAYWAAAAWGGLISLSKDDPDVIADLPSLLRLTHAAWTADPSWGKGALTSLLATLEASRPNGSKTQAALYFDQAIAQSGGNSIGPYLGKAELIGLPTGDRAAFEAALKHALAIQVPADDPNTLTHQILLRRALWLQSRTDELF